MFDRLLLLGKGGNELYFGEIGPDASTVIDYFESNGAPSCPSGANPAEWVVEITTERRMEADLAGPKWPQTWSESPQKQKVRRQLGRLQDTLSKTPATHHMHRRGEHAASFFAQLAIVLKRAFRDYWRDPLYLYSRFGLCICVVSGHSSLYPFMARFQGY